VDRLLLICGMVFTATAVVEIAFAEGLRSVRRPFDLRGAPPNREWYKRAVFHVMYVCGGLLLIASGVVALVS
jgi:hypothetical protein